MKTILAGVLALFSLGFAQQSRIAFINPEGQLATINPDGSDLRVLTEGEQRFQFPFGHLMVLSWQLLVWIAMGDLSRFYETL